LLLYDDDAMQMLPLLGVIDVDDLDVDVASFYYPLLLLFAVAFK
jgi:hypothetical protein